MFKFGLEQPSLPDFGYSFFLARSTISVPTEHPAQNKIQILPGKISYRMVNINKQCDITSTQFPRTVSIHNKFVLFFNNF